MKQLGRGESRLPLQIAAEPPPLPPPEEAPPAPSSSSGQPQTAEEEAEDETCDLDTKEGITGLLEHLFKHAEIKVSLNEFDRAVAQFCAHLTETKPGGMPLSRHFRNESLDKGDLASGTARKKWLKFWVSAVKTRFVKVSDLK